MEIFILKYVFMHLNKIMIYFMIFILYKFLLYVIHNTIHYYILNNLLLFINQINLKLFKIYL